MSLNLDEIEDWAIRAIVDDSQLSAPFDEVFLHDWALEAETKHVAGSRFGHGFMLLWLTFAVIGAGFLDFVGLHVSLIGIFIWRAVPPPMACIHRRARLHPIVSMLSSLRGPTANWNGSRRLRRHRRR